MDTITYNDPNGAAASFHPSSRSEFYEQQHSSISKSSMFFQILPAVVQNHMPNMPSIRQSIGDLRRTRTLHGKNDSMSEGELPATPPPEYVSRPGTGVAYGQMGTSFDLEDEASISSSASSIRSVNEAYETATGISWQYARHGMDQVSPTAAEANADSV